MDPSVSCFLVILSLALAIIAGLAEQYFLSLNENKLEYATKQGLRSAKLLHFIHRRSFPLLGDTIWLARISTLILLGISLHLLLKGLAPETPTWLSALELLAFVGIAATLLLVLPRTLQLTFRRKYIGQLFFTIQIVTWFLFSLPTLFTVSIIRGIATKIFPTNGKPELLLPLRIQRTVTNGTNTIVEQEPEVILLQNALDFSRVRVRDCMVPRNEIVAIDIESDIETLRDLFVETHFSKILVYKESSDNLIGYVHSYELFSKPTSIKSIMLPVFIVPETLNAQEVFEHFVKHKRSIAVVLDEFGGTVGMVTIEDVIEEIFGEIDDEHDSSDHLELQLSTNRYRFAGRLEIEYLNEKYRLNIPESEEYDTLAGFVVATLEDIPEANACFETEQFLITVNLVKDARIEQVELLVK